MLQRHAARRVVLPAYAGMIPFADAEVDLAACAPRVCGDDPDWRRRDPERYGCSPRMRG